MSRFSPTIKYFPPNHSVGLRRLCSRGHPECRERPRNPFYDPYYEESVWSRTPRCYSGRKSLVTIAPGVGTGPELMEVVKRVCVVANAPVIFEEIPMGDDADEEEMENLIYSIERNGVAIKGNIEPKWTTDKGRLDGTEIPRNTHLRKSLDLFVNLIEIKSYPGLVSKTRLKKDIDVVLVRQNTEGEFSMLEHETGKGVEHLKITTRYNTRRLAEFAFKYAVGHDRHNVTVVYNREFMQTSERLFLDTVTEVAAEYPDVALTHQTLRRFVSDVSSARGVVVTGALYGGMIASLLFGLTNGSGLFCGQNLSPRYAVFEPAARNKGYKLAGRDSANPVAVLVCAVHMLKHLGHVEAAGRIQRAVDLTVNEDQVHTTDVLGTASCHQVAQNVERRIREVMPEGYDRPTQLNVL